MSAVRAVVAQISAVVPLYDYATAKEYAMNLLHVQVVLCALGASLSWAFAGLAHVSFGFALLALVGFEVGSAKLLKTFALSQVVLLLMDIIWLALWAHRIDAGEDTVFHSNYEDVGTSSKEKYATVSRFLLACQCLVFILRPFAILAWAKLWDLDFGGEAGGDMPGPYANMYGGGGGGGHGGGGVVDDIPSSPAPVPVGGGAAGPYSGGGTFVVPPAGAPDAQQQNPGGSYTPPPT